jgi:hypothetical protein
MEQETASVGAPTRLAFKVLFGESERARPWTGLDGDAPQEGEDVKGGPPATVARPEGSEDNEGYPCHVEKQNEDGGNDHGWDHPDGGERAGSE